MSELNLEPKTKEREYSDVIPDEDEMPSPYEKTYRDGSAVNECWAEDEWIYEGAVSESSEEKISILAISIISKPHHSRS